TERGELEVVAETTTGGGYFVLGSYAGVTSIAGVQAPNGSGGGGGPILVGYELRLGMKPGRLCSYESIASRY
ncbi:MAG TPA: hypothetical protein VGP46_07030, partial [Acidimicrobiales bacterium]|nr:hypothetical protein [Acidimicrobiales bacterium]